MTANFSEEENELAESFEYLAITLMQIENFELALNIFEDIGKYFAQHEDTPDEELKQFFLWFYFCVREKYGEDFVNRELEKHGEDSEGIRRFYRVMSTPDREYPKRKLPEPTAENVLKQINTDSFSPAKAAYFRRNAEYSEKVRLAEMILAENDSDKKAEMLRIYLFKECPFPLDPNILIEYANSENESLRDTAAKALSCIRADCVRNFARETIAENNSCDMLNALIYNCREDDREIIFKRLNDLADNAYNSDIDSACNLHDVMFKIIDTAESIDTENKLLNELLMFAYENSPCSCCRENIVDELAKRNLMTEDMIAECRFDSNGEIREKIDNLNKNSFKTA